MRDSLESFFPIAYSRDIYVYIYVYIYISIYVYIHMYVHTLTGSALCLIISAGRPRQPEAPSPHSAAELLKQQELRESQTPAS